MNDVVPLLAVPSVFAAAAWRQRAPRRVRWDLHSAIQAQTPVVLTDAGREPLLAVARALALPPGEVDATFPELISAASPAGVAVGRQSRLDPTRAMLRPLGLQLLELESAGHRGAPAGRVRIHGHRRGRPVTVVLDDTGAEVHVDEPVTTFSLEVADLVWAGAEAAPGRVRDAIEGLVPAARWNGLRIAGGYGGVSLRREPGAACSWMHDLWLAELLADAAPGPAQAPA